MIREWIRHECIFSTRDANSVKIAQLKRRTTPALLFKHYIFISEDLRRAETLIFLITKVNSISLFMCFVSQSLSSAAAVCLCLQTGTLGLSPHAILAILFQEKKNSTSSSVAITFVDRRFFFVLAQLYREGCNVNSRVKLIQLCIRKRKFK